MFMGLVGFVVVVVGLSWGLLSVWKPGGVKHARKVVEDGRKGKELSHPEMDIVRARVDVIADSVKLTYISAPSFPHPFISESRRVEAPILTDISARFASGEVSAIMGPSGSGKSTFLRMCAGRPVKAGLGGRFVPEGKLLFNGVRVSKKTRRICAFVEQGACPYNHLSLYYHPSLTQLNEFGGGYARIL